MTDSAVSTVLVECETMGYHRYMAEGDDFFSLHDFEHEVAEREKHCTHIPLPGMYGVMMHLNGRTRSKCERELRELSQARSKPSSNSRPPPTRTGEGRGERGDRTPPPSPPHDNVPSSKSAAGHNRLVMISCSADGEHQPRDALCTVLQGKTGWSTPECELGFGRGVGGYHRRDCSAAVRSSEPVKRSTRHVGSVRRPPNALNGDGKRLFVVSRTVFYLQSIKWLVSVFGSYCPRTRGEKPKQSLEMTRR